MQHQRNPLWLKKSFYGRLLLMFVALNLGMEFTRFLANLFSCGRNLFYYSEAQHYVRTINKAQQAYYLETAGFSKSLSDLGVGLKPKTKLFEYSIDRRKDYAFSYGIPRDDVYEKVYFGVFEWNKKIDSTRSYVGAVFLVPDRNRGEKTSKALLCEANSLGRTQPPAPIIKNGEAICGAGTKPIE